MTRPILTLFILSIFTLVFYTLPPHTAHASDWKTSKTLLSLFKDRNTFIGKDDKCEYRLSMTSPKTRKDWPKGFGYGNYARINYCGSDTNIYEGQYQLSEKEEWIALPWNKDNSDKSVMYSVQVKSDGSIRFVGCPLCTYCDGPLCGITLKEHQ